MFEVRAKTLVDTLADRLAEVEGKTLGEKHAKKKAEAQVQILAGNVTEWQVNTFGDLLSVVKGDGQ